MKQLITGLFAILATSAAFGQKQNFDILSYTVPTGWTVNKKTETASFTKEGGTKGFCIITLYKSIDATADTKQNFDLSWESLVKSNITVNNPVMQPATNDKGWITEVGSSAFQNDGISGTAILMSATKNSKLVNIIVLVNGTEFITEMQHFLETISMELPAAPVANNPVKPAATTPDVNAVTPQHEVWMSYKYNMVKQRYAPAFFLKYANGDCLDYVPEEGVLGFSKVTDNKTDRHWGIAKDKGKEIHMEYPGGTMRKLGKTSATKMSYPPGDNVTFYFKCVAVDGLKLEGTWSSGGSYGNPNWYTDAGFKEGTIRFYKDGRFENNGGLYTSKEANGGYVYKDNGSGTYYIKDFTIVMTYTDGQVFKTALTGFKNISPFQDNTILLFREVPFYKKLK